MLLGSRRKNREEGDADDEVECSILVSLLLLGSLTQTIMQISHLQLYFWSFFFLRRKRNKLKNDLTTTIQITRINNQERLIINKCKTNKRPKYKQN